MKLDQGLSSGDPVATTATWVQVPNKTKADQNNTASLAQSLGGTSFNGIEDVEISPLDGKVYFTAKGLNKVYRLKDDGATASQVETFVGGLTTNYSFDTAQGTKLKPGETETTTLLLMSLGTCGFFRMVGKIISG